MTAADRFLNLTQPIETGCVIFHGARNSGGYGSFSVNGRMVYAHRYAWEEAFGPVPAGMEIDHACWQELCVEVSHLRLATRAQNNANRSGAHRGRDLPRGVYRNGHGYRAAVKHGGTTRYFGTFPTP